MSFVDFHTHFLPGVDDGAESVEKSYSMLKKMADEGVDIVFATPHCLLSREDERSFIDRRNASFDKLKAYIEKIKPDFKVPEMRMGAEIRVSREMKQFEFPEELVLEGTNLMLFELPYGRYSTAYGENIYNLSLKAKVTPVIAHIERYIDLYSDYDYNDVFSIPNVICQITTGFIQEKKIAKFASNVIRSELPLIFGSDSHNMDERPPYMASSFAKINKFCSKYKIPEQTMIELFEFNKRLI